VCEAILTGFVRLKLIAENKTRKINNTTDTANTQNLETNNLIDYVHNFRSSKLKLRLKNA